MLASGQVKSSNPAKLGCVHLALVADLLFLQLSEGGLHLAEWLLSGNAANERLAGKRRAAVLPAGASPHDRR